jgi:hypothetical protein
LQQRSGIERNGLTSAANKVFCESLGCYDRVLAYEETGAESMAANVLRSTSDFAGNARFPRQGAPALRPTLRLQLRVGGTN